MQVDENGISDLPQFNPLFAGVKENRYTYLLHSFGPKVVDGNYKWPIKKFDNQEKKVSKIWGPDGIIAQEARYIADPSSTEEEDGIIMTTGYNWKEESTSLFVVDPKSMETLQEYKFPERLSV